MTDPRTLGTAGALSQIVHLPALEAPEEIEWSAEPKEALVRRVLRERDEAYLGTIQTLAFLVEAKDHDTRRHLERSYRYGLRLARMVAPELAANPQLGFGFLLHDIGKVGIPERILHKEGPLTPEEWVAMRAHPLIGARIVAPIRFLGPAVDVIRSHHEWFDGTGYPQGLRGEEIPLAARVFTVVDVFDAITTDRPYRSALPVERALDEIARGSGTHFDPEVVEAFLILMEEEAERTAEPAPLLAALAEEVLAAEGLLDALTLPAAVLDRLTA